MEWQEEVLALEEVKQIYEKLYGWKNAGNPNLLPANKLNGYTQQKLADQLNFSQEKVSRFAAC